MAERKKAVLAEEKKFSYEEKKKAIDVAISHIEKEYGKGAVMKLGDKGTVDVETVPTGSISLDKALGVGGIPKGRMGFTVIPFGQGFKDMSPPTKELMKLVLEKRIAHGGHPVLRWMMDNIYIRTNPAGNIKADKEKSTEKIDGAVATIMALDRAIRCGNDTTESVYESRGLLVLG